MELIKEGNPCVSIFKYICDYIDYIELDQEADIRN